MDKEKAKESLIVLEKYTNFLTLTREEHFKIIEAIRNINDYLNVKHSKK